MGDHQDRNNSFLWSWKLPVSYVRGVFCCSQTWRETWMLDATNKNFFQILVSPFQSNVKCPTCLLLFFSRFLLKLLALSIWRPHLQPACIISYSAFKVQKPFRPWFSLWIYDHLLKQLKAYMLRWFWKELMLGRVVSRILSFVVFHLPYALWIYDYVLKQLLA